MVERLRGDELRDEFGHGVNLAGRQRFRWSRQFRAEPVAAGKRPPPEAISYGFSGVF
jgi:hypothetical protein